MIDVYQWTNKPHTETISAQIPMARKVYSGTHEDDEKIAKTRDVTLNHRNTFYNAKWPPKTCSL